MDKSPNPHARRLVLLFWFLVAAFYFYLSYDFIRVSMADREFGDYLRYVVQLSGTDRRPNKDIRAMILVKAEELDLPLNGEQITILGSGEKLTVAVDYQASIDIPVFADGIYTKHFSHQVQYNVR